MGERGEMRKREMMEKKGVFFSTDALIAVIIIISVLLIAFPALKSTKRETQIHYDVLRTLSTLKVAEADNAYLQSLISAGAINNTNNSILEQIGEFYVTNPALARTLADAILADIETNQNIGIWYGSTLVYSRNTTPIETAQNVETARQIISGIQEGGDLTGFSARAFLVSGLQTEYTYFGGYVGDGNISIRIEYYGTIITAKMELAINNDFDLYVNSILAGSYSKSATEFSPVSYEIPLASFVSGVNTIELRGNNLHVAGGFIKITYDSSSLAPDSRYYFPGINGLINVYDGFYIPGDLDSMDISLHLNTPNTAFLTIGNTTVFRNSTTGVETITIPNSELDSLLDYSDLSRKTVPLRLGLENVSFEVNTDIDVISVADFSKAMKCSVSIGGQNCDNNPNACSNCGGIWGLSINQTKSAHHVLIDEFLSLRRARLGISGYHSAVPNSANEPLTNDTVRLNNTVNSWEVNTYSSEQRKLCLGIEDARDEFIASSGNVGIKIAIVMMAGNASHGCGLNVGDLNLNGQLNDPGDQAIQVACDAYQQQGIIFHSVAYGSTADAATLQQIARCGNGTFYSINITELSDLYRDIVNDIKIKYQLQTIGVDEGNLLTRLYEDSYIQFNYSDGSALYGLYITTEKKFDNDTAGTFSMPSESAIARTEVVSYSGPRWTDKVRINGNLVYDIVEYTRPYIELGDPYVINIPNSFVVDNNAVYLTTGLSPTNSTSGSADNKIIYTVVKNTSAYSRISPRSDGCNWNIQFEDYTNISIAIPMSYLGAENCYYQEASQVYNENDATQNAIFELLEILDLDSDNKVDLKFTEQDLQIDLSQVTGIPYTWSTEVHVRTWY